MKNTYMKSVGGFTLVEIVISITISVIILTGVLFFLQKLQRDILISEQGTYVNTELTDFMAVMRNFSKLYDS
jgi:type II secretory pathway component PulJ